MKTQIDIKKSDITNNLNVNLHTEPKTVLKDLTANRPAIDLLTLDLNDDFFNYLNWLGLAKETGLIVLSSEHHYFYDKEDLRNIKTMVNKMPLNKINNLKQFIYMISNLIPHECYFTGCFTDNKKQNLFFPKESFDINRENLENGILSKIPVINIINNFLDKKTNNYMSKKNVKFLLESNGFKVVDMTELNSLTYFCARKLSAAEK